MNIIAILAAIVFLYGLFDLMKNSMSMEVLRVIATMLFSGLILLVCILSHFFIFHTIWSIIRVMKETPAQIILDIELNWDGSDKMKSVFHSNAKKVLNKIAEDLGYSTKKVRCIKGGPAVLGDAILHTDNLYISLGNYSCDHAFYFRRVKSTNDYTGGTNNWMTYDVLATDWQRAIEILKNPWSR